jgi:alkaline phosphatase D
VAWLKRELMNSQATWKVIAADMPIGLVVVYDTIANGASKRSPRAMGRRAAASSRSRTFFPSSGGQASATRLADRRRALHGGALLRSQQGVFQDFEPFWEFVSGRSTPEPSRKTRSTTPSDRSGST